MDVLEPHLLAWWQSMHEWHRGNAMFREHDFCGLYMMLAGYAIENLCKGDAVDGLTSEEQIKRRELEEKVASGQLSQSSIVQECWKLTADEREQVKTDGKLPDRLKRHELVAFVTATGLPLTTDEQETPRTTQEGCFVVRPVPGSQRLS